jgi:hypothetical protein
MDTWPPESFTDTPLDAGRECGVSEMCHSLFSVRPNAAPPSGMILPIVGCGTVTVNIDDDGTEGPERRSAAP